MRFALLATVVATALAGKSLTFVRGAKPAVNTWCVVLLEGGSEGGGGLVLLPVLYEGRRRRVGESSLRVTRAGTPRQAAVSATEAQPSYAHGRGRPRERGRGSVPARHPRRASLR